MVTKVMGRHGLLKHHGNPAAAVVHAVRDHGPQHVRHTVSSSKHHRLTDSRLLFCKADMQEYPTSFHMYSSNSLEQDGCMKCQVSRSRGTAMAP